MESKNLHIVAIVFCIGVVAFSFFVLGLDKIVVKPLVVHDSKTKSIIPEPLEEEPVQIEIIGEKSPEEIQYLQKNSEKKAITSPSKENQFSSKIKQLENNSFTYSSTGTFTQKSSIKKHMDMSLNLKPISGTALEKFEIISGKIIFDSLGVTIEKGTLVFDKNNQITLLFSTSYDSKTLNTIYGKYQETVSLNKNKKINISFSQQSIQLSPKMKIPFIIDVSGNMIW